jgi:hypothetical protein
MNKFRALDAVNMDTNTHSMSNENKPYKAGEILSADFNHKTYNGQSE